MCRRKPSSSSFSWWRVPLFSKKKPATIPPTRDTLIGFIIVHERDVLLAATCLCTRERVFVFQRHVQTYDTTGAGVRKRMRRQLLDMTYVFGGPGQTNRLTVGCRCLTMTCIWFKKFICVEWHKTYVNYYSHK